MGIGDTIVALCGTIATFGTIIIVARMWFNRAAANGHIQTRTDPQIEARLERIEIAVNAIAIETERIAEGQRFTTKLLSNADLPSVKTASLS